MEVTTEAGAVAAFVTWLEADGWTVQTEVAWADAKMRSADLDLHNGDCGARASMWSRREPIALLGAAYTVVGCNDVSSVFKRPADQFSDCRSFEIEVLSAEAGKDFGYIVAIERTTASIGGRPRRIPAAGDNRLPPRGR